MFLAIIVLGVALRLFNLAQHDFWLDEVLTHEVISGMFAAGPDHEFNSLSIDKHPPFYYALLRQWSFLFGLNEFSLRFFSVIFSVLSIIILYKLGVLFFDKITALIGAALMALSPFHIWYAQEARMFSLSVFFTLAGVYIFFKALEKEKIILYWVIFSLVTLCLISTTYFALFLFIPELIIILSKYRRCFVKWALSAGIALLIFALIILPTFISQFNLLKDGFWLQGAGSAWFILISLVNFITGYSLSPLVYWSVLSLMIALAFAALIKRQNSKEVLFLILFSILPLILVFLFDSYIAHIYLTRHLIIFSPFLYLLLSKGITSLKHPFLKITGIAVFLIILSCSLYNYYADKLVFYYEPQAVCLKKPVRPLVAKFLSFKKDGDALGFTNNSFMVTFQYYLSRESKRGSDVPGFYFYKKNTDLYFERILSRMHAKNFKPKYRDLDIDMLDLNEYNLRNIWVFFASWNRDGSFSSNDREVKRWFDARFPRLGAFYIDGVLVNIYQIRKVDNEK